MTTCQSVRGHDVLGQREPESAAPHAAAMRIRLGTAENRSLPGTQSYLFPQGTQPWPQPILPGPGLAVMVVLTWLLREGWLDALPHTGISEKVGGSECTASPSAILHLRLFESKAGSILASTWRLQYSSFLGLQWFSGWGLECAVQEATTLEAPGKLPATTSKRHRFAGGPKSATVPREHNNIPAQISDHPKHPSRKTGWPWKIQDGISWLLQLICRCRGLISPVMRGARLRIQVRYERTCTVVA